MSPYGREVDVWRDLGSYGHGKSEGRSRPQTSFFGQGEPSLITWATPNPSISVSSEGDDHRSPMYKVFLGKISTFSLLAKLLLQKLATWGPTT